MLEIRLKLNFLETIELEAREMDAPRVAVELRALSEMRWD
jgi:hypothetical protein